MKLRERFTNNPQKEGESNAQYFKRIASIHESTPAYIRKKYYQLKRHKKKPLTEKRNNTEFKERNDSADLYGQAYSLDDLLEKANVDLLEWEVESYEIKDNSWDVTMKNVNKDLTYTDGRADGFVTQESGGDTVTNRQFYIKAKLRRRKDYVNTLEIDWKSIFSKIDYPTIKSGAVLSMNGIFDRLVFTDTHIGMEPNKSGFSQYGGVWNEEELNDRGLRMMKVISDNKRSDTIVIDDLGDLADGWDGQTARKHHDLPQNMDNQKTFDVALSFKLKLIAFASANYAKVIVNNICEDNHSASFGYVINSALKTACESMFKNVEVTNHRRFMNHYKIENNIFIICHGKDSEHLKFGFSPQIKDSQISKIDDYIDDNFLLQPNVRIEFSKGDSHQMLFDWDSSTRFDYFNYPALSPSSNWIQTNYKKSAGGFVFFNYMDTNEYIPHYVKFDWKK